jgi:hypothetical protein
LLASFASSAPLLQILALSLIAAFFGLSVRLVTQGQGGASFGCAFSHGRLPRMPG